MRLRSHAGAALLLAGLGAGTSCGPAADEPPPSIVVVSLDTLRADHTSLLGYDRETTPFLEELAEESHVFTRALSVSGWTLTAHMSLLTGLYPPQHGVDGDGVALSPRIPLLAELLADEGYQTIGLYEPGWIHPRHGFARGFDRFRAHQNGEQALEHLEVALDRLDPDRPAFVFLHLFDAHAEDPSVPGSAVYEPPSPYPRTFSAHAKERIAASNLQEQWYGEGVPPALRDDLVDLYDGGVRYVDDLVEEAFGELEEHGWADDAWIVVTSDHGESLGQRDGHVHTHGDVFQEGLHVPLVVRPPGGAPEPVVVDDPVSIVDVVPTLLDEVGVPHPADLPGESLLDPAGDGRILFAQGSAARAWIRWPWKLVEGVPGAQAALHLGLDPAELHPVDDRVPAYREREAMFDALRAEARVELGRPLVQRHPTVPAPESSDELRARLRALGYGGS